MKTLLKLYLYISYILVAPIFLLFSIGIIIWGCFMNLKDFGEVDFKEVICAYFEGAIVGHYINMAAIESACDESGEEA